MDKRLLPHAVFPRVFTGADGKMRTELKALLKVDPPRRVRSSPAPPGAVRGCGDGSELLSPRVGAGANRC